MAGNTYRSRWRVQLDTPEGPATLEVTTSAKDSAAVVVPLSSEGRPQFSMGIILEIVHNAFVRTETPFVPRAFDEFLDVLIDADEIEEAPLTLDPTHRAQSDA